MEARGLVSPWRPFATLAAALAGIAILVPVAQRTFAVAAPSLMPLGAPMVECIFTLVLAAALLAVALLGRRLDGGGRMPAGATPLPMASLGAGLGLAGLLAAAGLAALAALAKPGASDGAGLGALLLGTFAIFLQSAAEEVYFRGWLQPALAKSWGSRGAVLVAAAAFAALHLMGGARAPLSLLNLFLGGLLFGLLAVRTGGLAAPVGAHFAWNWAEQILLGLDPNPGIGSFGAILDLDLVGSPAWGGSDEGLNASLAAAFVLLALLVPLALWRPRTR